MNNFDVSKKFTVENFAKHVAPILRKFCGAVEVHDTESLAATILNALTAKIALTAIL